MDINQAKQLCSSKEVPLEVRTSAWDYGGLALIKKDTDQKWSYVDHYSHTIKTETKWDDFDIICKELEKLKNNNAIIIAEEGLANLVKHGEAFKGIQGHYTHFIYQNGTETNIVIHISSKGDFNPWLKLKSDMKSNKKSGRGHKVMEAFSNSMCYIKNLKTKEISLLLSSTSPYNA